MGKYAEPGWLLEFYDSARPFAAVDDLIPGVGDVYARAVANKAKNGTPYFLRPDGRSDARINLFWRDSGVRTLKVTTQHRYAWSLKVWLDFLEAYEVEWDNVTVDVLAAFKDWRMSAEDAEQHVEPGTFRLDLAALRRFYQWASARYPSVDSIVRARVIGETFWGRQREKLEASPSRVRQADVKWLSPDAYRQWRNVGLRGYTGQGLPPESWVGRTEDRDVAFADGLYRTGLRRTELSSLLTVEVPETTDRDLYKCELAAACAKRTVGRWYWMPVKALQAIRFYLEEGSRPVVVARAQRTGRYHDLPEMWLLESRTSAGKVVFRDQAGRRHETRLAALTPKRRATLYRETPAGLEPLALWLNHLGMPLGARAWNQIFPRANDRVLRLLGPGPGGGPTLWARPHMLRHSFALRWFSILTFVQWQRTAHLSQDEQRDLREELGGIWFIMATLLGHSTAETSKSIYLESFQALEIDQLVALTRIPLKSTRNLEVRIYSSSPPSG